MRKPFLSDRFASDPVDRRVPVHKVERSNFKQTTNKKQHDNNSLSRKTFAFHSANGSRVERGRKLNSNIASKNF